MLILVIALLLGIFFYSEMRPNAGEQNNGLLSKTFNSKAITPTPMQFSELTIPYLKNRSYTSKIGELTPYGSGTNYTSYVTSYDSDGIRVNGLLTIPTTERPQKGYPAIVFVHGYVPPQQYMTTEKYVDYVDYLARNGFVVFKIDLRGHGQSEGEAGGAYFSADYVIDTLNARAALQDSDFVNPEAVGLWGHSMAGNILLRSMAAQPDIPAISIWAGAVYTYKDMRTYGIQDSSYQPPMSGSPRPNSRQRLRDIHGDPESNSPFWQQMAPTNYLDDIKGAIQLNHAVDDDVVTIQYSRDLKSLLDKTSLNRELHEYQSGGHNINGPSFVDAMENTVRFYKQYLQG